MKYMKQKGILLVLSLLLLIAAGIYLTFGWYTKMTSVSGMEYSVAQWDFTANYSISDIVINVYTYSSLDNREGDKAAPGTAGEIPILLSARESETSVNYLITIDKTTMSEEFQERIYFYTDEDMEHMLTDETPLMGTIPAGESDTATVYWKWIYEFEDIPTDCQTIEGETAADFDAFDTEVGKRPALYEKQMNATIHISGIQSQPQLQTSPATPTNTPAPS